MPVLIASALHALRQTQVLTQLMTEDRNCMIMSISEERVKTETVCCNIMEL